MPDKTEVAWNVILDKYEILAHIKKNGFYTIKASEIKKFREPRLMAKWDSSDYLTRPLKNNKLNILPISRTEYIISDFKLYETLPEPDSSVSATRISLPNYESLSVEDISSESNAINALLLSGALDDFLGRENTAETFNGRQGSGNFSFLIDSFSGFKRGIKVNGAQLEIDGGFENNSEIVIMEAKNVIHPDFLIRQLYYPYRCWRERVNKPIRLVFSQYANQIYRLFEYSFNKPNDYSSIELINTKNYTFEDLSISNYDISNAWSSVNNNLVEDRADDNTIFIQADSVGKVIALVESLSRVGSMSKEEIAEELEFTTRQSDYYSNAGKYLGLISKKNSYSELTAEGKKVASLPYKEKQLRMVQLMCKHSIFHHFVEVAMNTGDIAPVEEIQHYMYEHNTTTKGVIERRAGSVRRWLTWIFSLPKVTNAE
ncbi:Uncharacterised protein [Scardovia inopinata]|uniref:Type II restriction endonuclease n=1 Tax=Scardovia inopinata F0304 TaxID=641146 RepID=W5IGM0_SCAIO|nr:hypothetical protein [Scardovia inopinata]EFG26007.1 hypothetical protein HMPREF9020_01078 [Scardovia inopinata F0304]BAR07362.1 conserved hypothetical protein [Scardovia inopinata JCM 12537]SUV51439.1 Uncharacterised protein [Scardovia inopinata]